MKKVTLFLMLCFASVFAFSQEDQTKFSVDFEWKPTQDTIDAQYVKYIEPQSTILRFVANVKVVVIGERLFQDGTATQSLRKAKYFIDEKEVFIVEVQ